MSEGHRPKARTAHHSPPNRASSGNDLWPYTTGPCSKGPTHSNGTHIRELQSQPHSVSPSYYLASPHKNPPGGRFGIHTSAQRGNYTMNDSHKMAFGLRIALNSKRRGFPRKRVANRNVTVLPLSQVAS